MSNRMSPNYREVLSAISSITGKQEYLLSTNGALNITGGGSGGGGTQYASGTTTPTPVTGNALIFDNSGTLQDVSLANPLPVAATFSGTVTSSPTFSLNPSVGSPTPAFGLIDSSYRPQVSVATALPAGTNAIGSITNTSFIVTQATASNLNATITGSGTAGTPAAGVVSIQGISGGTVVPVSGTITANAGTNLNTSALALESGGNLASINTKIPALGQALGAASLPVVLASDIALPAGSNHIGSVGQFSTWNITNVSGTVSLPTGASTSAKQPALGTAGTASSDVLTVQGITSMTPLKVDGSGVTQPVSGTFWQTTQPVSLTSTTITGTVAVTESGTWNVGLSAGTNAIGSITNTSFAATQATAANLNATVVGTGTFAVQSAQSGTWTVGSNSATASAVPANAFYKGLLAKTANPSAASDGNLVGALSDKLGKQIVVGSIRDLKVQQTTTITASTSETTVLTAVASTFLDVYGVIIANSSLLATVITFKDSTAGTTRFTIAVPAGETRGFMLPESGAYTQATVNNNWTATSSVSLTSLFITLLAVKNI